MIQLPDDIAHLLRAGRHAEATHELMKRRSLSLAEAQQQVEGWLAENDLSGSRNAGSNDSNADADNVR